MADLSKHSDGVQPSHNQVDNLLLLRTMRWQWILVIWVMEWFAFSVVLLFSNAAAPVIVFMALFGGWQLGCVSERNEWHTPVTDLAKTDQNANKSAANPPKSVLGEGA